MDVGTYAPFVASPIMDEMRKQAIKIRPIKPKK
jgi:hypothetical protein